jgi:hypothetical protein
LHRRPPSPSKRADVTLWDQIHGFYEEALAEVQVHENEIPIFQVLTFSHYHFLTATAALMRCHLSEMFGAVRAYLDHPMKEVESDGWSYLVVYGILQVLSSRTLPKCWLAGLLLRLH